MKYEDSLTLESKGFSFYDLNFLFGLLLNTIAVCYMSIPDNSRHITDLLSLCYVKFFVYIKIQITLWNNVN